MKPYRIFISEDGQTAYAEVGTLTRQVEHEIISDGWLILDVKFLSGLTLLKLEKE